MSEVIQMPPELRNLGMSRVDKHLFLVLFEFIGFIMTYMVSSMLNMSMTYGFGDYQDLIDVLKTTSWGILGLLIIHVIYMVFLSFVVKKDEEIKELNIINQKLKCYFLPGKSIILNGVRRRDVKPVEIYGIAEHTERLLSSSMIRYICRKLIQNELPTEYKLDLIFKKIQGGKYFGDLAGDLDQDLLEEEDDLNEDIDSEEETDEIDDNDENISKQLNPDDQDYPKESLVEQKVKFVEKGKQKFIDQAEKLADDLVNEIFKSDEEILRSKGSKEIISGPKEKIEKFLDQFLEENDPPKELREACELIREHAKKVKNLVRQFSLESQKTDLKAYLYLFDKPISLDQGLGFKNEISLQSQESEVVSELNELFGELEPKAIIIWKPYNQDEIETKTWKFSSILNNYIRSYRIDGTYFYMGSVSGIPILLDILALDQMQFYYNARFTVKSLNNLKLNALTFLLVALAERWDRRKEAEDRNALYSRVMDFQSKLSANQISSFLEDMKKEIKTRKTEYQMPKKTDLTFWVGFILGIAISSVIWLLTAKIV